MEKNSTSLTELTITIKMKMVPLTVWVWQGRSQTKASHDPELLSSLATTLLTRTLPRNVISADKPQCSSSPYF